jgi:hypothetical protein
MYHAIRGNIQTAIESNWAKGEAQALNDFLGANSSVYGTGTQSPYKTQVTNYSESDPSQIMNTNDGKSLSLLSQATGYAWTQKVLGNVMSIASNDALGGTKKSTPDDIINQMVSKGMITATEGSELLAAAPHSFGSSSLDYVRQGTGAQKVIQSLYDAEYDAVNGAVLDYQHTPNISDAQISENQKAFVYNSGSDDGLAAAHFQVTVQAYTKVLQALRGVNATYQGMLLADKLVYQVATQDKNVTNEDDGTALNPQLDPSFNGGKAMPAASEAGI